jgi:hypothetical protein
MIGLLCFVLAVLASPFKSKLRLQAENAVLRHQLNGGRPQIDTELRVIAQFNLELVEEKTRLLLFGLQKVPRSRPRVVAWTQTLEETPTTAAPLEG